MTYEGRFLQFAPRSCATDKRWGDPGFFSCKRAERPPDLPGPQDGSFAWIWGLYRISEEASRDFVCLRCRDDEKNGYEILCTLCTPHGVGYRDEGE